MRAIKNAGNICLNTIKNIYNIENLMTDQKKKFLTRFN